MIKRQIVKFDCSACPPMPVLPCPSIAQSNLSRSEFCSPEITALLSIWFRFKRSGEFDRLRRELLAQFRSSVRITTLSFQGMHNDMSRMPWTR